MKKRRLVVLVVCLVCCTVVVGALAGGAPGRLRDLIGGYPDSIAERLPDAAAKDEDAIAQADWWEYLHTLPIMPGTTFEAVTLPLPVEYELMPLPLIP